MGGKKGWVIRIGRGEWRSGNVTFCSGTSTRNSLL